MSRIDYRPVDNSPLWKHLYQTVVNHCEELAEQMDSYYKPAHPLIYLVGAEYPGNSAAVREGASYKSLAYVAHRMEMSDAERQEWYWVAKELPLSQAHVGQIIARLEEAKQTADRFTELLAS